MTNPAHTGETAEGSKLTGVFTEVGMPMLAATLAPTPSPVLDQGMRWRAMEDAPADGKTLIVARHKPNERTPHGWVATILLGDDEDESANRDDQIIHYNGNRLLYRFNGTWTGWMYPEEFAALASHPLKDGDRGDVPEACLAVNRRKLARFTAAFEGGGTYDDGDISFLIRMAEQRLGVRYTPTAPTPSETAEPAGDAAWHAYRKWQDDAKPGYWCESGFRAEFAAGNALAPQPARLVDEEALREAWNGATLETRLRSYPAAPPGSDALSAGYVCDLMREAADALAQTPEATGQGAGDAEDAERFRALMRCPRIKMQGSSGVDPKTGRRRNPEQPGSVHFGAEFWPTSEDAPDKITIWGRHCLRSLADDILECERRASPASKPATGEV